MLNNPNPELTALSKDPQVEFRISFTVMTAVTTTRMPQPRSFLESLASLDDPTPVIDIDPESHTDLLGKIPRQHSSESEIGEEDEHVGREHYMDVEKGRIRREDEGGPDLGSEYVGKRIGRGDLEERDGSNGVEEEESEDNEQDQQWSGIDSDHSVSSDLRRHQINGHDRSTKRRKPSRLPDPDSAYDSASAASDPSDSDNDMDSASSVASSSSSMAESKPKASTTSVNRAHLRDLMSTSQPTSVTSSLSAAARADKVKGQAVLRQRLTFDNLLNVRIKMQNGLIAANGLRSSVDFSFEAIDGEQKQLEEEDIEAAARKAEEAALKLLQQIDDLRTEILYGAEAMSDKEQTNKRKFREMLSTHEAQEVSLPAVTHRLSSHERLSEAKRDATLTKWSNRVNLASSSTTNSGQGRFGRDLAGNTNQLPLTSMLRQQLQGSSLDRLVEKARRPGNCVDAGTLSRIENVHVNGSHPRTENDDTVDRDHNPPSPTSPPNPTSKKSTTVYDDTTLYTLLLRDLVESRKSTNPAAISSSSTTSLLPPPPPLKIPKQKRQVDTKASKGRKMRYTVHEKLQDFMKAEDLGRWEQRQREDFFRGLFGGGGGEGKERGERIDVRGDGEELEMEVEEGERLRLFG